MKTPSIKVMTVLFALVPFGASSDYSLDQIDSAIRMIDAQDIVITFSRDLGDLSRNGKLRNLEESSVEQACLALTLAQMLRNPMMNGGNESVNVSVFLRNDGVKLADTALVETISEAQSNDALPGCVAPGYEYPITLAQHLANFLASVGGDNDLVNCPICWCAYKGFADGGACAEDYYTRGYPGVLNPAAVPPLFLGAEKVIDF